MARQSSCFRDLTDQTFGDLSVVSRVENTPAGKAQWSCRCTCGATVVATGSALRSGNTKGCGGGHRRMSNLVDRVFGDLTVVESLGAQLRGLKSQQIVRCLCRCGKEWVGPADSLMDGNTQSCGCLRSRRARKLDRATVAIRRLLRNYRRHAARRGLVWELSEAEFAALLLAVCHYCGAPPTNHYRGKADANIVYSGLDRADNDAGYTVTNTVSCCAACNLFKRNWTVAAFLAHVEKIHQHQRRQGA